MIACYDLSHCPPTFDAVAFLALAELERLRLGEDHIEVAVLPGPCGGFRRDGLWPHTIEERIQLRDRVLVPLMRLLPSVSSVEVLDTRAVEGWGKGENHIGLPAIVRALKQGCRPLRSSELDPADSRASRTVTFTLREAEHHPLRNSRVDQWVLAAEVLTRRDYTVMFVRDAAALAPSISGYTSALYAPTDLNARALLYSVAALNVGISNGPMWMSIFMDAPTLMLRPTTNEAGACYDDYFFRKFGISRGEQLPASPPYQRLVWEEDHCANIVRAVEEVLADVQSG